MQRLSEQSAGFLVLPDPGTIPRYDYMFLGPVVPQPLNRHRASIPLLQSLTTPKPSAVPKSEQDFGNERLGGWVLIQKTTELVTLCTMLSV